MHVSSATNSSPAWTSAGRHHIVESIVNCHTMHEISHFMILEGT
jgi:hypothetical protein